MANSDESREALAKSSFPEGQIDAFGPFGHPVAGALGLSIFGIWRLLKDPGLPPLRTTIEVRSGAENAFALGLPLAVILSAVVPWIVFRSLIAVILIVAGITLFTLGVMLPPLIRDAIRDLPPRGTYWDGSKFIRDRSFPLGRRVEHFERSIATGGDPKP